MSSSQFKRTIDRMVEDAIRRILPSVMNEVLVATIARGTEHVVSEERPVRPRKGPKKRKQVREQRMAQQRRDPTPKPKKRSRADLQDLLSLDESAGAEFYHDPSSEPMGYEDDSHESDGPSESAVSQRIQALPPELRGLAEGLEMDDDGGEMWGSEHDSVSMPSTAVGEIRNVVEAAKHVGVDFSRMRSLIGKTAPKKVDRDDAKANMQFEQMRIKRMREQLNDGKPVE